MGRWPIAPGGEAGEARAVVEQVVEVRGRDELGARLAVHVDELREQELDVVARADVGAGTRRPSSAGAALHARALLGIARSPHPSRIDRTQPRTMCVAATIRARHGRVGTREHASMSPCATGCGLRATCAMRKCATRVYMGTGACPAYAASPCAASSASTARPPPSASELGAHAARMLVRWATAGPTAPASPSTATRSRRLQQALALRPRRRAGLGRASRPRWPTRWRVEPRRRSPEPRALRRRGRCRRAQRWVARHLPELRGR